MSRPSPPTDHGRQSSGDSRRSSVTTAHGPRLTAPAQVVRPRRRRWGCLLGLALLLGGLGFGGAYGYAVYNTMRPHLASGQAHLEQAVGTLNIDPPTAITPATLTRARQDFAIAAADFHAAQRAAGPLLNLAPAFGWLPQIGGDVSQAPALLALAADGSDLGSAFSDALGPAVAQFQQGAATPPTGDSGLAATLSPLIDALEADPAAIGRARTALAAVQADRAALDADRLSVAKLRTALDKVDAQLPKLTRAFNSLDGLSHAADLLLGRSRPITFLVLVQNADELRATGGFISAVGLLTIDRGKFTQAEFSDSYAIDNFNRPTLAPPADLAHYMQAQAWFIRDSNWAPDFPRSAQAAENFYQLDKGVTVDGTLAVDQHLLGLLLQATGPITLPGYPDPIRSDNVVDLMRHYFMPTPGNLTNEWWKHRKDFMGDLFHALAGSLHTLPRANLLALALALATGMEQKHLLITTHDAETMRWLTANGADGAVRFAPGDALAVVDTNMGFNKVNSSISQTLAYTATLPASGGLQTAAVAVTYHNSSPSTGQPCVQDPHYKDSYAAMTQGCYFDYMRVYAPAGATLTHAQWGADVPPIQRTDEYSLTSFVSFLTLAPGETRTLSLSYTLPAPVGKAAYRLAIRKQPGTDSIPATVAVQLPPGASLRTARPTAPSASGWVHFPATPLTTDLAFTLDW